MIEWCRPSSKNTVISFYSTVTGLLGHNRVPWMRRSEHMGYCQRGASKFYEQFVNLVRTCLVSLSIGRYSRYSNFQTNSLLLNPLRFDRMSPLSFFFDRCIDGNAEPERRRVGDVPSSQRPHVSEIYPWHRHSVQDRAQLVYWFIDLRYIQSQKRNMPLRLKAPPT